jgi:hypothetical protein
VGFSAWDAPLWRGVERDHWLVGDFSDLKLGRSAAEARFQIVFVKRVWGSRLGSVEW